MMAWTVPHDEELEAEIKALEPMSIEFGRMVAKKFCGLIQLPVEDGE
jgi:hypothetical protein